MKPYYVGHPDDRVHSLYGGATSQNDVAGMFSFFPCRTSAEAPNGFPRPTISMPQIKATHKQSYKRTYYSSADEVAPLWRKVVRQVEAQGCRLGVRAEMPELRAGAMPAEAVEAGSC